MHRQDRIKKLKKYKKNLWGQIYKKTSTASDGQTKKKKKRGTWSLQRVK